MNRYTFRLESVRRVRRVQADLAMGALVAARRGVAAADEGMGRANDHLATIAMNAGTFSAVQLLEQHERAQRAVHMVVTAIDRKNRACDVERERESAWSALARQVAGLDHLDERRRAEHATEELRAEAVLDDDRAALRHRTLAAESAR